MFKECEVIKELQKGGQKTVSLGKHDKFGNVVLKEGIINSSSSLERIIREVKILKSINSKYYPKQYSFDIDISNDRFYIVEEYIEGATLDKKKFSFEQPNQILNLMRQLVEGLSVIWEQNIVHRDLKPHNIIIRPNNEPCIIDLGIARFLNLESLTNTFFLSGPCTPIYASPEQLTNSKMTIDPRTDMFTLGIIALELYLGQNPFDSKDNQFSIPENIINNRYITSTNKVSESTEISNFAHKVLQQKQYNRPRNKHKLMELIG